MTSRVAELVIAGWTGRDEQALRKHIRELEAIGVKPPKSTPIFYRVAASLFTHAEEIQASGPDTSGEVEGPARQAPTRCRAYTRCERLRGHPGLLRGCGSATTHAPRRDPDEAAP